VAWKNHVLSNETKVVLVTDEKGLSETNIHLFISNPSVPVITRQPSRAASRCIMSVSTSGDIFERIVAYRATSWSLDFCQNITQITAIRQPHHYIQ